MQHVRVLIAPAALALLALGACAPGGSAPGNAPATATVAAAAPAAAKPAAAGATAAAASAPEVPKAKVGEALDFATELTQIHPAPGKVSLTNREGRPAALFFWGTGNYMSREDLVAFDQWAKRSQIRKSMDVYAVASFSSEKSSAADVKDMAAILGISEVPVITDPDFALQKRIGADQFPEIDVIGADGKVLAKALRGIDHANLRVTVEGQGEKLMSAADYLQAVAAGKTGPAMPRTWQFYPSDRLLRKHYPDFEAPLFSPAGWNEGKRVKVSSLISGKRPAVLFFFSSTCDHCQHDMPQLLKFLKEKPDAFDVVGITRIRNAQHRKVSDDYFKQMGIQFPIVEDQGAVSDLYQVTSTPTAFYLSPGGTVGHVSYYQHADLAAEWMKLHANLVKLPAAAASAKGGSWEFPLSFKDEAGKDVALASMAGKPTLLHFWATWCAPCRTELPDLVKRIPEIEKHGNVVMATVEDDPALVGKYRQSSGLSFKSFANPHGGLAEKIDFARSVPRTYLLDPKGEVIAVYAGTYEWADEEKFSRILGRMAP